MNERLNKPKVFLSHSKADSAFVERLYADLRKCQIDPWLDSEDIRHGKPWLDSVFEDGIPTCDCILVYLTEHSVRSAMVKKELDAALLQQLKDKQVALLPYVNSENVRDELRADIQALQVPVLNSDNYASLLPRVVAEIWRSFLERTVASAVRQERVRRLEAELELEKLKKASGDSVFTPAEEREFEYIRECLDRFEPVEFREREKVEGGMRTIGTILFEVSALSILPGIADSQHYEYSDAAVVMLLRDTLEPHIEGYDRQSKDRSLAVTRSPELADELLMYGFVQRVHHDRPKNERGGVLGILSYGPSHHFVYTDRLERFKYWLAFKGSLPQEVTWRKIPPEQEDSAEQSTAADLAGLDS